MKITFLGTRGFIDIKTSRHNKHTATLIEYNEKRIMIDCGIDWRNRIDQINPNAIIITHPHPDHSWGLKGDVECPVYATPGMWRHMPFSVEKRVVALRRPTSIFGILFEAFPVVHSIKVPSVGYRISAGSVTIFCVHDLIAIRTPKVALTGIQLYIGDGATITRPIIRRRNSKLFGHTTIRAQIGWCQKYGVDRAIFTHCGTQIVSGDGRSVRAEVRSLGMSRGVHASIAYDGQIIDLN